jgi:hypothetical protein
VDDEEAFRALLDERGVLRPGALEPPVRAFTVFAQRPDACIDVTTWRRHAERFFRTQIGLTVTKRYDPANLPIVDAARIVVSAETARGTRLCYARPAEPGDLDAAEQADNRAGYTGMATLAARCKTVWLVALGVPFGPSAAPTARTSGANDSDRIALLLSAILASVLLGPILSPDKGELFGVRTARLKLEAASGAPYR